MSEELNKILWDNLDIESNERPMKAKLQEELEDFIKRKIDQAVKESKEERIIAGLNHQSGDNSGQWKAPKSIIDRVNRIIWNTNRIFERFNR